ncbi:MAG TPA: hypothetical protein VNW94_17820 [Streptosporangiaceae bacterium]|nr:hypothetical protein [Streptosporangiaceae bacterium]
MTPLDLDDIPPLRGPRPAGAPKVRRRAPAGDRPPHLARRSVLTGLVGAGGTVGLAALGAFSPVREAVSGGYRLSGYYDIYPHCPSYAIGAGCSPGCGPSYVCADCCQTKGYRRGFHKSRYANGPNWALRPNQCYAGSYSGWLWKHNTACGACKHSVTWRCHDGYKRTSNGSFFRTICRWATACS